MHATDGPVPLGSREGDGRVVFREKVLMELATSLAMQANEYFAVAGLIVGKHGAAVTRMVYDPS